MPPSSTGETPPLGGEPGLAPVRRCLRCASPRVAQGPVEGDAFCCAGCALAIRVPRDAAGNFPANAALAVGLVIGLLAFNQVLLASLSWATSNPSPRWTTASLACGGLVVLGLFVTQWRVGVRRSVELVVAAGVVAVGMLAIQHPSAALGLVPSIGYTLWSLRGWARPPHGSDARQ